MTNIRIGPVTVPFLRKKTPKERGQVAPESLAAALNWHKIMEPDVPPGKADGDGASRDSGDTRGHETVD